MRESLASGPSDTSESAGEVRASELARRKRLKTLCRLQITGDICRFDVEQSWTGLFEGASKRIAPKSFRRAVQDRRASFSSNIRQNSPRWAHPSRTRRASLSNSCLQGEPIALAPRHGAATLEGVPDEDALSSQFSCRVGIATTPLVRTEARSRMAFPPSLAT